MAVNARIQASAMLRHFSFLNMNNLSHFRQNSSKTILNCCRAKLSAEDVCRTDNFLDRLDNISSSSTLLLWIKI